MKTSLVLILLMGACTLGLSQTLIVKDRETRHPLEMATVVSEVPRAFTTTNSKGEADISAFRGSKRIEVRFLGYKTEVGSYDDLELAGFLLFLTPSILTLDQIVVSAARWSQPAMDTPERIATISPEDLFLQNPQTAADLLTTSGEVFMQKSQQGGGSPMIRGFATNRLLYTVDGVRMNTAIFRSGNIQNVISLDPFAMENTEVMFGPGSVMYGSDAIGGVMSFQTLVPRFSLSEIPTMNTKAVLRTSSANREMTGHVDLSIGWAKWAAVTSFSSFNYGDLTMGRHGPAEYLQPSYVERRDTADIVRANPNHRVQHSTGYSQINVMQKVRYAPKRTWDIQYSFNYSATSDYSRYDRLILYRNGKPRSAEWYYGPQIWIMNNLSIYREHSTPFFDRLTVRLAHQFFKESRNDRDLNDTELRRRVERVNAYSLNLDFNKSIDTGENLYYGVEAVYDDVNSLGTDEDIKTHTVVHGPARYPQSTWLSYAAFVSYQWKFSDEFLLHAGTRYNRYLLDARFDTTFYPFPYTTARISNGSLTGSLGLVYHPATEWSISANLSTAFRSPNVDDMGKVFDSEPGFVIVPNPGLGAEYAYNAEVGTARMIGETIKIDLTAYYTFLKDALVRRDFTLNGLDSILYDGTLSRVQAVQNAARAFVYGLQLGFEIQFPSGLALTSHVSFQKGEEELDDGTTSPSRHAAPWFGTTHVTYSFDKMIVDLYAVYNGTKGYNDLPEEERQKAYLYAADPQGRPYSPGWYTLNLAAMLNLTESFSVSAGCENIADRRYRPYSSGIAAPGRNFVLSVRGGY